MLPAINETDRPAVAATAWDLANDQARLTPEAPAVVEAGAASRTVSYRHLMRQAEELAGEIAKHGLEAGSVVAICLDRRVELVVAVLAGRDEYRNRNPGPAPVNRTGLHGGLVVHEHHFLAE